MKRKDLTNPRKSLDMDMDVILICLRIIFFQSSKKNELQSRPSYKHLVKYAS